MTPKTIYLISVLLVAAAYRVADAGDTPVLQKDVEAKLKTAGWLMPAVLYQSPEIAVVSALKHKVSHVVIIGDGGKFVDAGVSKVVPTVTAGDLSLSGVVELQLGKTTQRANDGFDATSEIILVRSNGSIACRLEGSSSSSTGTGCGSGGWTKVGLAIADQRPRDQATDFKRRTPLIIDQSGDSAAIDVVVEYTGTWSERDAKGKCVNRSPVRSGPINTRYVLSKKAMCKKIPMPK
jgi:hypothetical protein